MNNLVGKYRKDGECSYALGTTIVFELLKNNIKCDCLYVHSKFRENEYTTQIFKMAEAKSIEIIYSDKIFNTLSDKENCFLIGKFKKYTMQLQVEDNHVVLVNISNSGNLGTIMRTSLGFGIRNIAIIGQSVDIFDPKTIRASMGAIFSLNVELFNNFEQYQAKFSTHSYYPFMLKAKTQLHNVKFASPYSLIFGNESSGLDDEFLNIGTPIIIKHENTIDSLNLAISVAIAIFHATK